MITIENCTLRVNGTTIAEFPKCASDDVFRVALKYQGRVDTPDMIECMRRDVYETIEKASRARFLTASMKTPKDFTDAMDALMYSYQAYKTYALGEWGGAKPGKMVMTPKQVIFSGPKTIVLWPDGTKTIVSLSEGEEYDEYTAFCAAFVKKVFGSTHRAKKFLNSIKSCPAPKVKKSKVEEVEQVEEPIQQEPVETTPEYELCQAPEPADVEACAYCQDVAEESYDNCNTDIGPCEGERC